MTTTMKLSPEMGYRLAGLVDGEGCFSIHPNRGHGSKYVCSFQIKLRGDDKPFLETFRNATGLGVIREGKAWKDDGAQRQPWVSWVVSRKSELLALTGIFDTYTPISKKAKDYTIWRDAVVHWYCHQAGDDWEPMHKSMEALRAGRKWERDTTEATKQDTTAMMAALPPRGET